MRFAKKEDVSEIETGSGGERPEARAGCLIGNSERQFTVTFRVQSGHVPSLIYDRET